MWGMKLGREGPKRGGWRDADGLLRRENGSDHKSSVENLNGSAASRPSEGGVEPGPDSSGTTFLFDHLPKTGGSAFKTVLEQIFGVENVSPAVSGRPERWAKERYAGYRVIHGHFHSPVPMRGMLDERVRMTILRHPIDRIVSEYFYYRNDVERVTWNKLAILAKDHDLGSYVNTLVKAGDSAVSNRYCRHFATQISRQWLSDSKLLSFAKQSLARYDFVGIQEHFVDSVDVFCCLFHLPPVTDIPLVNVTSSRAAVSEIIAEARETLRRVNGPDIELYEFALRLFQSKKRAVFRSVAGAGSLKSSLEEIDAWGEARSNAAADSESFGDRSVEFCKVDVTGERSNCHLIMPGEPATISFEIAAHVDVPDLTVGMEISDELGEIVFGTNTHLLGRSQPVRRGHRYCVTFSFPANLKHGSYRVSAALHTGASHEERCFHWCDPIASFEVSDDAAAGFVGYCRLEPRITWESAPLSVSAPSATGG